MAVKIITCPWCGKEARITYEENRVYQMKCYSCHNTMLHVDHSFDSAVEFFEHQANLLQAEQDGRLVVLPCKVVCGTTIWCADSTIHTNPVKCEVGSFAIYTGPDGDLKLWINCYVYGTTPMSRSFRMSSIGKTVFLTREEAEAALAGKGGEG